MKNMIFAMLISFIFLSGCYTGSSKIAAKKQKMEDCIVPHNPYNDGGGHDTGFNWARLSGDNCDGHSRSFNEGCLEYYRQLTQYKECINKSRK